MNNRSFSHLMYCTNVVRRRDDTIVVILLDPSFQHAHNTSSFLYSVEGRWTLVHRTSAPSATPYNDVIISANSENEAW